MFKPFCLLILILSAAAVQAVDTTLIERIRKDFTEPKSETYLTIVNRQKMLTPDDLEKVRIAIKDGLLYDVKLEGDATAVKGSAVEFAMKLRAESSTNMIAFAVLVDLPVEKQPLMLSDLEGRWAVINVKAMGAVKGEQAIVRMEQMVYRAFGTLMGAGYSGNPLSLLASINDVDELGKLPFNLEPEATARMQRFAEKVGLNRISIYRGYQQRMAAGEVPPLNPARWKMWEERTGKSVSKIYKELGYDAAEVKAAYEEWLKQASPKKREKKTNLEELKKKPKEKKDK